MAKMFYTESEAAKKLKIHTDGLKQLARNGLLREFRDGPRLMFKADQVEELTNRIDYSDPKSYLYEAMNSSGQSVKGTISAINDEAAISLVRGKGFFPTKLTEYKEKAKKEPENEVKKKTKWSPPQPFILRLLKAVFILAVGFVIGFAVCFSLLAK